MGCFAYMHSLSIYFTFIHGFRYVVNRSRFGLGKALVRVRVREGLEVYYT